MLYALRIQNYNNIKNKVLVNDYFLFQGFQQALQGDAVNENSQKNFQSSNVSLLTQTEQSPKKPLPSQHQVIQDVFDRLKEKGLESPLNPVSGCKKY